MPRKWAIFFIGLLFPIPKQPSSGGKFHNWMCNKTYLAYAKNVTNASLSDSKMPELRRPCFLTLRTGHLGGQRGQSQKREQLFAFTELSSSCPTGLLYSSPAPLTWPAWWWLSKSHCLHTPVTNMIYLLHASCLFAQIRVPIMCQTLGVH